jgi:hypothetical protein
MVEKMKNYDAQMGLKKIADKFYSIRNDGTVSISATDKDFFLATIEHAAQMFPWGDTAPDPVRAAVEQEREECAKVADGGLLMFGNSEETKSKIAARIRARGAK